MLGKPSEQHPLPLRPYNVQAGLASWLLPLALAIYAFSTFASRSHSSLQLQVAESCVTCCVLRDVLCPA